MSLVLNLGQRHFNNIIFEFLNHTVQLLVFYTNSNHGPSIPPAFLYEIIHKWPYSWSESAVDKAFKFIEKNQSSRLLLQKRVHSADNVVK